MMIRILKGLEPWQVIYALLFGKAEPWQYRHSKSAQELWELVLGGGTEKVASHRHNNNNNKRPLTPKSMPPAGDGHAKLKT